jgi:hypothetical protein
MRYVKDIFYFPNSGKEYTEDVLTAVVNRVKETGIKTVVVATTSGSTGVKVAERLKKTAKIIAIGEGKMKEENIEKLKLLNVSICEDPGTLPLSVERNPLIRNTYYTFGQGMKVAVEIVLIAVDKGLIDEGEEVISIGGTGEGADTALVVKSASSKGFLGSDINKRLEVYEIIAMPRKKKWWE